jgi:hypothetical protein
MSEVIPWRNAHTWTDRLPDLLARDLARCVRCSLSGWGPLCEEHREEVTRA